MDLLAQEDPARARTALEAVSYHPELDDALLAVYDRQIGLAEAQRAPAPRLNGPADAMGRGPGRLHPPFRRITTQAPRPALWPFGMALPELTGAQNDIGFLLRAAATSPPLPDDFRIAVFYAPDADAPGQAARLATALAAQAFTGRIGLTVFDPQGRGAPAGTADGRIGCELVRHDILSPQAAPHMAARQDQADLVIFLSGPVQPDDMFLTRAAHLGRVSDMLVQPLVAMPAGTDMHSPYSVTALRQKVSGRYPFRDLSGLNFAVSPRLLAHAGLPDTRFDSRYMAGREIGFRLFNLGGYFAPLGLTELAGDDPARATPRDQDLYVSLCPNSWDRKSDGIFETPKISVYIPAYNAENYIGRAIDSVLEQDLRDLEICIADDGSRDGTLALLERNYGTEPRVRWRANRNGGIGYASNSAIRMSRGVYIGQLDSDDCLKPGALRRLSEHLDAHPQVVCCYGSCERINAEGGYIKDEYSWPVFSREKMMLTSIVHHFRMFRRAAWERTTGFREDIVNAVDYDIFLKLAETGQFHHIDEKLYQRRWHGANTSNVNESHQTSNTYRVQTEALRRQGLDRFWKVDLPDPSQPRRVSYARTPTSRMVMFWPNYSRSNTYQNLLYGTRDPALEICAGNLDAALAMQETMARPQDLTFHLHWLNFLFLDMTDPAEARAAMDGFLDGLARFKARGSRLIWTIHNTVSHDSPFVALETELSARIAAMADVVHFHSEASVAEVEQAFPVPHDRIRISRHGSYVGVYPDFVTPEAARAQLNLAPEDDVLLFTGQIRPYKGVEQLIEVVRRLLAERPRLTLLLAGSMQFDLLAQAGLTRAERARIRVTDRFIDDMELQLFFRAADIAVYPYQKVLTSGSLLLALGFGVPAIIPDAGMTREVLGGRDAGQLYGPGTDVPDLEQAVRAMLAHKDAGRLAEMSRNAHELAQALDWPDIATTLLGGPDACIDTVSTPHSRSARA
ncbi:hypothetical protein LCGC14_1142430 [marine sediment metagenome]|uniref:Uncharacterized protein n=1 Tax=marine sediment metagenome TaxID=412755 RepID=A0A0F9PG17_9ZZZZ